MSLHEISTSQMLPNNQHQNQHSNSLNKIHATTQFSQTISKNHINTNSTFNL